MTKYILHGGKSEPINDTNTEFFRLLVDHIPDGGLMVFCNFARANKAIEEEIFQRDLLQMRRVIDNKNIKFELATHENIHDLLDKAHVLLMAGGSMIKLQKELLTSCPDFIEKIKKLNVVAGTSAGACILCRDYINDCPDTPEEDGIISEGLNIIPYGLVVHYGAKKDFPYQNDLTNRKQPLMMIAESQFTVIEL